MAGLTLSKDEVRSMKRARRHEQRKDGFWAKARQSREESKQRARSRGWPGPGAGSAVAVEPSLEVIGTTVQVCGLWPFVTGSKEPG